MLVTAIAWSLILALSLEFARVTQSFDYRDFFRQLLGRAWFLFEIAFLALLLILLAVLGAASAAFPAPGESIDLPAPGGFQPVDLQ